MKVLNRTSPQIPCKEWAAWSCIYRNRQESKTIDFQSDVHVVQWSSSSQSLLSASLLPSLSLQMGGSLIVHTSMVNRWNITFPIKLGWKQWPGRDAWRRDTAEIPAAHSNLFFLGPLALPPLPMISLISMVPPLLVVVLVEVGQGRQQGRDPSSSWRCDACSTRWRLPRG